MSEDERTGRFDHLFSTTVRETIGEASYGDWRAIDAPDAVSLSYGFPFPESFPNDELVSAAEALFEVEGDEALQYGGGDYADALAGAVADRASVHGIDCDEEEVLLTNGSTNAIDATCQTFLDPGDALFTEAPTFMGSLHLFRNYGAEVTGFPLDEDGLDVDAVAAELEDRRAEGRKLPKLFYTIPNFQNPTGTTLPRDRRERLLDLAAEYDFLILEDDAYGELRYYGEDVPAFRALDDEGRVARVSTFSKTIAPGVRTGWLMADGEIVEQVARINAGGTNTFTLGAIARYFEDGFYEENLAELRAAYEERRDHMVDCLAEYLPPEADYTEPDGGFFIWVQLPENYDTGEMLPEAAEEGVVYLPGSMFFPDDRGENCLRISFSHVSLDEIERGIAALGRTTRSLLAES